MGMRVLRVLESSGAANAAEEFGWKTNVAAQATEWGWGIQIHGANKLQ